MGTLRLSSRRGPSSSTAATSYRHTALHLKHRLQPNTQQTPPPPPQLPNQYVLATVRSADEDTGLAAYRGGKFFHDYCALPR
jgi:hypothetical protein